jgi:hypothetical protein
VITKSDILALWLKACPSFGPAFVKSCAEYREDGEPPLYHLAGVFADHLLALHRSNQREEFPAIATFIEQLHSNGDHYTREFATIGILEDIQNVWSHTNVSPDEFLPYLQPLSTAAWHDLNRFWAGEIPIVPERRAAPDDPRIR